MRAPVEKQLFVDKTNTAALLQSSRDNNQHTSNILVCTVSFQVVFALKPLFEILGYVLNEPLCEISLWL